MSTTLTRPLKTDTFEELSLLRGTPITIEPAPPVARPAEMSKTVGADVAAAVRAMLQRILEASGRGTAQDWPTSLTASQTAWVVDLHATHLPSPLALVAPAIAPSAVDSDPPAFRAFKKLGQLLDATDLEVSVMVGLGVKTAYSWKRDQHEPRAKTTQTLYEYEAVIDGVSSNLSEDDWRRWLHTTAGQGDAALTRRDVLLAGRREDLAADIRAIVFGSNASRRPDLAARPEPLATDVPAPMGATTIKPSGRRPRRPKA